MRKVVLVGDVGAGKTTLSLRMEREGAGRLHYHVFHGAAYLALRLAYALAGRGCPWRLNMHTTLRECRPRFYCAILPLLIALDLASLPLALALREAAARARSRTGVVVADEYLPLTAADHHYNAAACGGRLARALARLSWRLLAGLALAEARSGRACVELLETPGPEHSARAVRARDGVDPDPFYVVHRRVFSRAFAEAAWGVGGRCRGRW